MKEYIYTWADDISSFIEFLIISGQRFVADDLDMFCINFSMPTFDFW